MSEQELENLLKRHLQNVRKVTDGKTQYTGYVDGEDEYEAFITDLNALGFSFYTRSGKTNDQSRALFSYAKRDGDLQIPFFGSPFQIVKSSYMYCSMDGNYKPTRRQYLFDQQPSIKKCRFSSQPTKKVGCQAMMRVKCLRVFDNDCYKLETPYKRHSRSKNKILSNLNSDLMSENPPSAVLRFLIVVSAAEDHNHTVVSTNQNQRLHPRLKEEIYNLVRTNPDCSTKLVKSHLADVVTAMFGESDGPQPDRENRCYYPTSHVIRFHMYQAHALVSRGGYDQEALARLVRCWRREYPEDCFLFRPRELRPANQRPPAGPQPESIASPTLLFCHQTKWQRHMLRRYGNEIVLLDAAHKTCKYTFPLYFLLVRTNCGEIIVGTFVIQKELASLIEEALSVFVEWNPEWTPAFFLCDYASEEMNALENFFPHCNVYISTFHREQAWDRWFSKKGNVPRKAIAPIKKLWQAIAESRTEDEYTQYTQSLEDMYNTEVYQDTVNAQTYFFSEWLPIHERWVEAYQRKDFVFMVNFNNGIECQCLMLQHRFLIDSNKKILSNVITFILENFLPDLLEKYSASNIPFIYREFNESVPDFLRYRPLPFIESFMLQYGEGKLFDATQINDMGDGLFIVRSEASLDEWCSVDFQEATCSCYEFAKLRVPCKHMCAVFLSTSWDFERLPEWYREHPYLAADTDFSTEIGERVDIGDIVDETDAEDLVPEIDFAVLEGEVGPAEEVAAEFDVPVESEEKLTVSRVMDSARDQLLTILGRTYEEHDLESATRFLDAVAKLNTALFSGAAVDIPLTADDDHTPLLQSESIPFPPVEEAAAAKSESEKVKFPVVRTKPVSTPQRNFPKLKISKKLVGKCDMPPDQWSRYVSEKVEVYPPPLTDQVVVVDVNYALKW